MHLNVPCVGMRRCLVSCAVLTAASDLFIFNCWALILIIDCYCILDELCLFITVMPGKIKHLTFRKSFVKEESRELTNSEYSPTLIPPALAFLVLK